MLKRILFVCAVFVVLLQFKVEGVLAANGCGGNMWCGDSKDYVTYECTLVGVGCDKNDTGIDSANCHATADDCWANKYKYSCGSPPQCTTVQQFEKVGCCTDGSGPGGGANGICSPTHYNCAPLCIHAGCIPGTSDSNNGSNPTKWTWRCLGRGTGSNTQCSETKIHGVCGSANGGNFYSQPNSGLLCNVGTSGGVSGPGPWTWSCLSPNGASNASCSANKKINGVCGSSNGGTFPSAPASNLCSFTSSPTTVVSGIGPWTWNCTGSNNGGTASCSANKTLTPIDGVCGSSNGGTFPSAPTSNLCSFTSSPTTVVSGIGPWTWNCTGSNNGGTASCSANKTLTSTCTLSLNPPDRPVNEGSGIVEFTAAFTELTGSVDSVRFTSSDTNVVTVTTPARAPSYKTIATIPTDVSSNQTITITAYAKVGGVDDLCWDSSTLTVNDSPAGPWWQVIDGDVSTNGNIGSDVPSGKLFEMNGLGGFPGVPAYGGILDKGNGNISSLNWNANTTTQNPRLFDYDYFKSLIPTDTTGSGYEWIENTGLNLDATNFGDRKVIHFIDGDLTINGNITLNDGVGFAAFFVSGNIIVSPTVRNLEGIYLSDGNFNTGVNTLDLKVRGSVAAESFNLERNLANNNTMPAEIFEFAPDQVLLFPKELMFKRVKWEEVAP